MDVDRIKAAINGAWAFCEEQQSALDRRLITEEQWFENHEQLIELARRRLPARRDRFFLGNVLYGKPERKFRFVCVKELDYAPKDRRREFFLHLLQGYVEKGGRLILGPWTEPVGDRSMADETTRWGHAPSGSCTKPHQDHEELERRLYWYDVS